MHARHLDLLGLAVALPFPRLADVFRRLHHQRRRDQRYVFSGDTGRAWATAQRLRSGNVGINSLQRNHEAPFGGFKQSGVGRDGGSFGLHAYSEMQSIIWPG